MTDLATMEPHEILARIENRNRGFKIASIIFGSILVVGLVVLLVLGLDTLQGVNHQLASQKKLLDSQQQILNSIKAGSDQNATHVKDLQNHIDCIVELFRQPNRQNLTIKDLNSCEFDSNGNIIAPSGGSNGPQKNSTSPAVINHNGSASSPAPASQPATASQSTPAPSPAPQNPIISTTDGLFCPISLTSFACSK